MNRNVLKLYISFIELHISISTIDYSNFPPDFFLCENHLFLKKRGELVAFIKECNYPTLLSQFKRLIRQLNIKEGDCARNLHAFRLAFTIWVHADEIQGFYLNNGKENIVLEDSFKIVQPSIEILQSRLNEYDRLRNAYINSKLFTSKKELKGKKKKTHQSLKRDSKGNSYFKIVYTGMVNG